MKASSLPKWLPDVWAAYFGEPLDPAAVLATRTGEEFHAVLTACGTSFRAVTFTVQWSNEKGCAVWDVADDGVPFDTVREFKSEPLTRTFF